MCDRMDISGTYDFICPYSIACIHGTLADAKREKAMFILTQYKDVSTICCVCTI